MKEEPLWTGLVPLRLQGTPLPLLPCAVTERSLPSLNQKEVPYQAPSPRTPWTRTSQPQTVRLNLCSSWAAQWVAYCCSSLNRLRQPNRETRTMSFCFLLRVPTNRRWGVGVWRDYMQLDGGEMVLLSVHFNYPQSVEDWPYYNGPAHNSSLKDIWRSQVRGL